MAGDSPEKKEGDEEDKKKEEYRILIKFLWNYQAH